MSGRGVVTLLGVSALAYTGTRVMAIAVPWFVLVTTGSAAQTGLVRALLGTGTPVVVAAMRNPYDVASFPEAPTVVDTFGYTAAQVESLVRALFGEVDPHGLLPVSIPSADGAGELFPYGHGLGY